MRPHSSNHENSVTHLDDVAFLEFRFSGCLRHVGSTRSAGWWHDENDRDTDVLWYGLVQAPRSDLEKYVAR
jgi:hypothetical protein